MVEKYGFVYIWFDKKKKMYYIGCHFGYEDDGYICSSNRMRDAYYRRPQDFKRRILKTNISSKKQTLLEEHRYLVMIKKEELSKKYYNKRNHHFDHWSSDDKALLTTSERISIKTKEAMANPDIRAKYLERLKKRNTKRNDPDVTEKIRLGNKGKTSFNIIAAVEAARIRNTGKKQSEEQIRKTKEFAHFKTLNNKRVTCIYCGVEGNPGNIGRYHNEHCNSKDITCK